MPGHVAANPSPRDIQVVGSLELPDRSRGVHDRILEMLTPARRRPAPGEGALPWWRVHQRLGGRVTPSALRGAVDPLLEDGLLIEVWLYVPHRNPSHVLLCPGRSKALRYPVIQARGRDDVLRREPWFRSLPGGQVKSNQK